MDTAPVPATTWPDNGWQFALVHPELDPDNSHPVAVALYDEALDSVVVPGPDGTRRQTVFCREATTREWLWRRGWIDLTEQFVAARDGKAATSLADLLAAACEATPSGVTPAHIATTHGLVAADVRDALDALVASGEAERRGGAVAFYRPARKAS